MSEHSNEYRAYLLSEHWEQLKEQKYKELNGKRCQFCGSFKHIHGHHMVYRNPLETCTTADVILLCKKCHENLHFSFERYGHLDEPTLESSKRLHDRFLGLGSKKKNQTKKMWRRKQKKKIKLYQENNCYHDTPPRFRKMFGRLVAALNGAPKTLDQAIKYRDELTRLIENKSLLEPTVDDRFLDTSRVVTLICENNGNA